MSRAWHLRRLAQFLLALTRGDGAGRRRPSPRTRPRTTAPWTAGRATTGSPLLRRPRRSARGRRSSSLPAPPRPPPCSQGARARPQLRRQRWGGALRRPRRLLSRPQPLRPQESRMDWGYCTSVLGSKGQSLSICINYRGSQVHMDCTMIKCILVLYMMIVTEDVSSRSNRYDFDLHRKSARGTTTKETGVRLSIKTQRATIKIMSPQSIIVKRITELTESKLCIPSSVQPNGHPGDHFE